MIALFLVVCNKNYRSRCLKLSKNTYNEFIEDKKSFVCIHICLNTFLPFSDADQIYFFSALYGEGEYPCGKCGRDCLDTTACIQCSTCSVWVHFECTNLSKTEYNSRLYYFCKASCEICLLPFTEVKTPDLIKDGIFANNADFKPKTKRKNIRKEKRRENIKKITSSAKNVSFDHFLKINCSYLGANEVDDAYLNETNQELTIFQNNVRSLKKNFHLVEEIFQKCGNLPSILAFTETKLNDSSAIPRLGGYIFEHVDSPTDCGGVGVYLSDELNYSIRNDLSLNIKGCEDLWIEITVKNNDRNSPKKALEKFVIGTIYRHPGSKYIKFCEKLLSSLDILNKNKTNYVLVGDYNINILKYNLVSNVTNYINSLSSIGCTFHVDKPTRVTANSSSCIDHVYSNLSTERLNNNIITSDVSDHFGIVTKINGVIGTSDKQDVYYRKSFLTPPEQEQFNSELKSLLYYEYSHLTYAGKYDANSYANCILNTYNVVMDKFMPLKKMTKKQKRFKSKPWLSKGIKISINNKNKLYKTCKKSNDQVLFEKYKIYRNILTRIKHRAREKYYAELAVQYGNDKSKIWKLINEISMRKRKNNTCIKSMKSKQGFKLQDPKQIANRLNVHFSTIGESMAKKFVNLSNFRDPIDYLSVEVDKSIYLSYTDAKEVIKLIRKLDNKKACGFDRISNKILKSSCNIVVPFIVNLFNMCIRDGIFPDSFKKAQVIPLFKGGDKEDPSCYRPISLLPTFGKLFEKIISVRIIKFFDKFNLFSPHQFGFRENYSAEYAILDIHEKLLNNLDKGLTSCSIFLDLAKAFDSVSHEILLKKLSKYGIRGRVLKLFESYLDSRYQYTKLGNALSSVAPVKFGVPQGSILGPLLFLIFINDLPNATKFFIKLFADDTFLCAQNSDIQLLENEVNSELKNVFKWLASNKLTLNVSKSKFMIVTNKKRFPPNFSISLNGECVNAIAAETGHKPQLDQCDSYKYLGVYIDKKLSWKPHIEYICKKIAKACGALAKLRHSVSTELLIEIYHALIHSYLRYGIAVWGNASDNILLPLQTMINRALRIMTFAPFGRVDLKPIYDCLKILDVKNVFLLETSKFLYKSKNDLLPTIIGNYFEVQRNNRLPNLRPRNISSPEIIIRLVSGEKSIQYRGVKVWENIPDQIKTSESFISFKKKFKSYLLENDVEI